MQHAATTSRTTDPQQVEVMESDTNGCRAAGSWLVGWARFIVALDTA